MTRASATIALCAFACALPLAGCGGSDDSGSGEPKTVAPSGQDSPAGETETTQGGAGNRSTSEAGSEGTPGGGSGPATPSAPGGASEDQRTQSPRRPKDPHKPHSGGGQPKGAPAASLTAQESATFETARALCANPDSLRFAPEGIRDDAEAVAKYAERFAPPGEAQIVHDACLAGLKSIGID